MRFLHMSTAEYLQHILDNKLEGNKYAVISIRDKRECGYIFTESKQCIEVLSIVINEEKGAEYTTDTAKKVVQFAQRNMNKADEIIVHCPLGSGRSPAIAEALDKIYNNSDGNREGDADRLIYEITVNAKNSELKAGSTPADSFIFWQ